jgi:hypothetical protein
VNGVAISQSALNSQLSSEIKNAGEVCAALIAAGSTTSPVGVGSEGDGTTPNAVTPAFADNALETLVLERLEAESLAKRGVVVTASDVTAASSDYQDQLLTQLQQVQSANEAPAGCPLSTAKSLTSQLPHAFLQRQAASLADQEQFEVAVGHVNVGLGALEAYYAAHRTQVTQLCLNVVVADTAANAQTLHDEIAAGTSFASAAISAAADQQESPSGGELQCEYPATVSGQFGSTVGAAVLALKTGQLSAPLTLDTTSSTGATTAIYVVVQLRGTQLVPFASLESSIRQAILTAHVAVVGKILNRLVGQAQVSVDPRYGTWSAKGGVKVPTPPEPAFVLNADANVRPAPLLSTGGLSVVPAGG